MKIRKLERQEHGHTRPLYETVFTEDSKSFVDYYYTEKTRDNQIYVAEEDGGIRAMLHLNPYTLMVNGVRKEANYIVAVATQKEYRGRRYMARLLERSHVQGGGNLYISHAGGRSDLPASRLPDGV